MNYKWIIKTILRSIQAVKVFYPFLQFKYKKLIFQSMEKKKFVVKLKFFEFYKKKFHLEDFFLTAVHIT